MLQTTRLDASRGTKYQLSMAVWNTLNTEFPSDRFGVYKACPLAQQCAAIVSKFAAKNFKKNANNCRTNWKKLLEIAKKKCSKKIPCDCKWPESCHCDWPLSHALEQHDRHNDRSSTNLGSSYHDTRGVYIVVAGADHIYCLWYHGGVCVVYPPSYIIIIMYYTERY